MKRVPLLGSPRSCISTYWERFPEEASPSLEKRSAQLPHSPWESWLLPEPTAAVAIPQATKNPRLFGDRDREGHLRSIFSRLRFWSPSFAPPPRDTWPVGDFTGRENKWGKEQGVEKFLYRQCPRLRLQKHSNYPCWENDEPQWLESGSKTP